MQSFYKHSNNEYRPMLIDFREDYCKSFLKRSVLDVILKTVDKYVNFNKPCPWPPGDYYVKDFNFGIKHVPSLVPEGRYLINITLYRQPDVFLYYTSVYFRITNYGILDLKVG